ncbi:MAG: hypothetical protein RLZZ597_3700 [Cyanobacteriota bacterium]|jgi:hypothetical protein
MTYAAQVQITADTALNTAHICYRKARRDCYRIHALLTHPRTVEAAKIAVWSLYVGAVIAYALGQTARIVVQHWVDAQVASALPTAHIAEAGEMVAAAEMTGAEMAITETEAELLEDYSTLTTPQLRRECTAVGIRWKDARGKNRHMTKAAMIAALESTSAAA